MRRETWLAIAGVLFVGVVLGVLLWQPPTVPTPTAPTPTAPTPTAPTPTAPTPTAPTPTTPTQQSATAASPATSTALPAPTSIPVSVATLLPLTADSTGVVTFDDGLVLALPQGWQGARRPNLGTLALADPISTPLLAAWQGAATYWAAPMRVTLIRTPRNGIALPVYLDGLAATLQATQGIKVTAQTITTTLRRDGLPAGALSFSLDDAAMPQSGLHAALIDATGNHLLLLTLTAPAGQAAAAETQFRALVASMAFADLKDLQ